jgi:hypothetical protein
MKVFVPNRVIEKLRNGKAGVRRELLSGHLGTQSTSTVFWTSPIVDFKLPGQEEIEPFASFVSPCVCPPPMA